MQIRISRRLNSEINLSLSEKLFIFHTHTHTSILCVIFFSVVDVVLCFVKHVPKPF